MSQARRLDQKVLAFFEPRFGYDFGWVRIHADDRAAASAAELQASAYTIGNDVVSGRGRYQPDSPSGRRLLAHELVHVIQQSGGQVGRGYKVSAGQIGIQRRATPQTPGNKQGADDVYAAGAAFILNWHQHVPSLNDILVNMMALGWLDEAAARASKYVPVRGPNTRAARSIVHPQYGQIAAFQIDMTTIRGKPFVTVAGWSIMPGKPGQTAAEGANGSTPQPGAGSVQQAPPSAPSPGPHSQSGPITTQTDSPAAAAPGAEQEPKQDVDALLKDNPHWRSLSKEDRKILEEFLKQSPEELSKSYAVGAVNTDVKLTVALKLSSGWPGEVAEAAKAAFTDPTFVIMLIVTLGIYVGLWLVPDPSLVTKAAGGVLTAVMCPPHRDVTVSAIHRCHCGWVGRRAGAEPPGVAQRPTDDRGTTGRRAWTVPEWRNQLDGDADFVSIGRFDKVVTNGSAMWGPMLISSVTRRVQPNGSDSLHFTPRTVRG